MPGKWHNEMEKLFPVDMREVKFFCSSKGSNTCRRADILLDNERTVELQHSHISENEIIKRFNDWNKFGKEIIWLLDGNTDDVRCELLSTNNYLIEFKKSWKYKSFIKTYDYVLLQINDIGVFKIELKKIRCKMILLSEAKPLEYVINILKDQTKNIWREWNDTNIVLPKLKVYQQGAGNGKTYGIWKNICENKDKEVYIIVTKQRSAKNVIYEELTNQEKRKEFHIENIQLKTEMNTNRHYCIKYTHKQSKRECRVMIGTIDSYCYNLSGSDNTDSNFFEGILNNIKKFGCSKVTQYGWMKFAGQNFFKNKKSEIWIDEVQDLQISYLYAFVRLMLETSCDVNIVGDKLQTLEYEKNFLTEIVNEKLPNINVIIEVEKNDNRRIKVKGMHNKINEIINFKKYNLKEINCDETMLEELDGEKPIETIPSPTIYSNDTDKEKISAYVELLIFKLDYQVNKYKYTPECFTFTFPIMTGNILAIELQTHIQEYWCKKFSDPDYIKSINNDYWKNHNYKKYTQYVYLHKHTQGSSINTKDSVHATRIMSIRSAKGDGRPVVFILGLTEKALKLMSFNTKGLVYESHIHVAFTRAEKKIYFGLNMNNDDIHSRFSSISDVEYLPFVSNKISIEKLLEHYLDKDKLKNIILNKEKNFDTRLKDESKYMSKKSYAESEEVKSFPTLLDFLKEEELASENKNLHLSEQVDWGYHCIKYATYLYKILFNIIENHRMETTTYINSDLDINIKKLSKMKIVTKSTKEFWKFLKSKQYKIGDDKMNEMPICLINKQYNWEKYIEIIKNTMEKIKKKTFNAHIKNLDPYESIVLIYMIDVCKNQQYADIVSPMDLYNITHFFNNDKNSKEKKLLMQIDNINNMVSSAFENTDINTKWNIFKHIQLKSCGNDIIVRKMQYPIIGYSENKVVHVMLKSSLNQLNFWDTIINCLIERFLIYNSHSDSDNEKYNNKCIESKIFILDQARYIPIDWDWDKDLYSDILHELKISIEKYYQEYHKDIFKYLNQIKSPDKKGKYWGPNTNCKTPFNYIFKQIKKREKQCKREYPPYICKLFNKIHDMFINNDGENAKKMYDNYENFNKSLNIELKKSMSSNFIEKVNDDIDYDF